MWMDKRPICSPLNCHFLWVHLLNTLFFGFCHQRKCCFFFENLSLTTFFSIMIFSKLSLICLFLLICFGSFFFSFHLFAKTAILSKVFHQWWFKVSSTTLVSHLLAKFDWGGDKFVMKVFTGTIFVCGSYYPSTISCTYRLLF